MFNWIKKLFIKELFVDASSIYVVEYELFVDSTGRLAFICYGYSGYVCGVNEWNSKLKNIFQVKTNKPVLDFLCMYNPLIKQYK